MVKVRFYGALKQFGAEFSLDVKNTAEIIRALTSQIPNLRQFILQSAFKIRIGGEYIDNRYLEKGLNYSLKDGSTVHFTPVLKGAKRGGLFQTLLGVALIGTAIFAPLGLIGGITGSNILGYVGIGLTLSGVAQMLTKQPSMPGIGAEKEKKSSTAFSNLSNMVAQGRPMPLTYGLIRTGSLIISQGVETIDVETTKQEDKKGRSWRLGKGKR